MSTTIEDIKEQVRHVQDVLQSASSSNKKALESKIQSLRKDIASLSDSLDHVTNTVTSKVENLANKKGFTFHFFSRAYLSRLFVSLGLLYVSSAVNSIASVVAGYRTPNLIILDLNGDPTDQKTLPDILHDILPEVHYHDLPDIWVTSVVAFTALLTFFHPKRLQIIRRFAVVLAMVYFVRTYTVLATSLPDASPKCQYQFYDKVSGDYKHKPMFPKALYRAWNVLHEPGEHVTCGDMVFSGHTSLLVMCAMVFKQYFRHHQMAWTGRSAKLVLTLMRRGIYLVVCLGALMIIATRFHYTLDVSLACLITFYAWVMYHNWARSDWVKTHIRLIAWLEAEEIVAVENHAFSRFQELSSTEWD